MGSSSSKSSFCTIENTTDFDISANKINKKIGSIKDQIFVEKFREECKTNAEASEKGLAGGKFKNSPKISKQHIFHDGKKQVLYIGPRGGKYIKKGENYISIKI